MLSNTILAQRGDKGHKVREIQEWLCLHGQRIAVDGDFGPATESAVRTFQGNCYTSGQVDMQTYQRLIYPITAATKLLPPATTLGAMIVAYAKQHLRYHPREVGGQNRGPWVRLYCQGHDGTPWAWCAGFVSYILQQSCITLNQPYPLNYTLSCDNLASQAQRNNLFAMEGSTLPSPGDVFLNRRTRFDWTHTGIVTSVDDEFFETIEGNTNDEGSREGYEVCRRKRGWKNRDFILLSRL